ncbi:hypothetical protein ACG7TL_006422 [Trametes sanguinea]
MATFYLPRRTQPVSRASPGADVDTNAADPVPPASTGIDLADQSIYIFPSPASMPPTPGGSVTSAPTDFDFSSESRSTSLSGSLTCNTSLRRRRGSASIEASSKSGGLQTPAHDHLEIDVEIWDVESDPSSDAMESEGSSWALDGYTDFDTLPDLGAAPSRTLVVSPDEIDTARLRRQRPLRYQQRSPKHSRVGTSSSLSSSHSSPPEAVPHPRIHLPLLSFFTSILWIDMDDPAVRLLTCADSGESESVLFPGHGSTRLLYPDGIEPDDLQVVGRDSLGTGKSLKGQTLDNEGDSEHHGLPKLLLATLSDQSTVAIQTLRAGLSARITPSSDLVLALPRASDLVGLWTILGNLYATSGRAWRDMWRAPPQ